MGLGFSTVMLVVLTALCAVLLVLLILQRRQVPAKPGESSKKVAEETVVVAPGSDMFSSDAFFATLSHELRTPLNGVLGIAQMINEEREDHDLIAIEGCARQMLAVISTLSNLSRIQAEWDELPEYREWISLHGLIEQIRKNVSFRASLRGLSIDVKHQDRRTRVRADRDHLRSIIENTLLGSLECVPVARAANGERVLEVSWAAVDGDVTVTVSNPRETFDEKRREHIQDVFSYTTGENHSRFKMEYLYWAVATALLEKYQGTSFSKPLEDGGVRTNLTFEMEQMEASEMSELPIGGLSYDKGGVPNPLMELPLELSILVAEDDPIARALLKDLLHAMGQKATFAVNGREVLDFVSQSGGVDVILMDIDMPIMDGVSATIALRNGESGEAGTVVPIVAMTAFNMLSDEGKFKRVGMDYYLPKPFNLKDLRSVLLEVIRKGDRSVAAQA